jgi:hypothetical protein
MKLKDLLGQQRRILAGGQGVNAIPFGVTLDYVQGADANGTS